MRSIEEFRLVQQLVVSGMSDCAISRATGIPRTTVTEWHHRPPQRNVRLEPCDSHDYSTLPSSAYAYLLGIYLGDGCVSRAGRVWRLRIALDKRHPGIAEASRLAINAVMPNKRAHIEPQKAGYVIVSHYSKHWPCLFPQHGPGQKHTRPIILQPWQQAHVDAATEDFIRGLIHSDDCRVVANDRGVVSVRYHFTNHSADIRTLYCAALDRLGIPWTQNSRYVIAVYRKAATARLDEFVGPKA